MEVALNQSSMSWCAVINSSNKAETKNRKCLISDYLKIQVFVKIRFTLDNSPSKMENLQLFPGTNRTCLLPFF